MTKLFSAAFHAAPRIESHLVCQLMRVLGDGHLWIARLCQCWRDMSTIFSFVAVLYLQSRVLPVTSSEERIDVSATAGGNVTLRVPDRGEQRILDITWVTAGGNHFATTAPNGSVLIRDDRYIGKLHGSDDASLIISHVTVEDQGLYRASVCPLKEDSYGIMYNIRVSENTADKNVVGHVEDSTQDPCVSCTTNVAVTPKSGTANGNRVRIVLLIPVVVVSMGVLVVYIGHQKECSSSTS
ncbi:uncharacterized protein LOC134980213 isoform X2 [Pseudophryne corroboree]|uniref:uncharacterized protein LOC134980213 isoform X2 n=1 Tax=Pseudophryne corroboree TaxID=495146 RepID=UPI0030818044